MFVYIYIKTMVTDMFFNGQQTTTLAHAWIFELFTSNYSSIMESPSVATEIGDISVCLLSAKRKSASSPSLRQLDQMSLW